MVAGNLQENFLKGNAAYAAGNVDAAIKLFQSIEPKGSAVWYNLGNCYYRLADYPQAIVHWSHAQKNASWRDFAILETYIAQSYAALGNVHDQSFMMRMHTWIRHITSLFSIFVLQLLFLFCWALLFFVLPRLLRQSRYYIIVLLSVLTLSGGLLCIFKYRDQKYPYGIVTKNSISVYAGPGSDYARLTEAKMLDKVRVYQSRDGWLKVHVDQFGYGWVKSADLAMI
jgi:tetratricopeptide (TPR) repeat protein